MNRRIVRRKETERERTNKSFILTKAVFFFGSFFFIPRQLFFFILYFLDRVFIGQNLITNKLEGRQKDD